MQEVTLEAAVLPHMYIHLTDIYTFFITNTGILQTVIDSL